MAFNVSAPESPFFICYDIIGKGDKIKTQVSKCFLILFKNSFENKIPYSQIYIEKNMIQLL